ncbi:Clavaminate synthase-like protein [Heliocybe sulcata]|uniref:Clavaminate synthase-like protein n=1 Tax=Heliocybe sulcata TaxID=5364 RepID=A0A5C3MRB5_9AGAM|nr:Clavaminate synthase-like protein [Heliocybe sulcata]
MYFGYEHPDDHPHAGMPLHGKNQFPDADIPEMRGFVLQYIDEVVELGKTLCDAMSLSLGLDTHYIRQQFLEPEPIPLCRCFNYHAPGSSGSTEVWGIGEHTGECHAIVCSSVVDDAEDFGLLTILKQDSPGLQVRSPEGRWVDVPVVTDGFVVNGARSLPLITYRDYLDHSYLHPVGDMLDMLTGGRFKSRPHRVLPPAPGTQRISFPFFFDFAWTAKMIPLPLPPLSEEAQKEAEERWGGTTFRAVQGEWWQYLAKKVQKVFPDLKLPDFEANEVPSSRFAIEVPVAPPGTSAA